MKQPIQRVNYYFRGIALPPGPHVVEMAYRPVSFRYGAMVSLVGAVGMGLWWLGLRRIRRRGEPGKGEIHPFTAIV